MIYLLDTNVCILYLNRRNSGIQEHFEQLSPRDPDEKQWQEKFCPTNGDRLGKTQLIRHQMAAIALV